VVVIGDFNTHSHVSVNDCQLNMNDNVFFIAQQDDKKKEREKTSCSIFSSSFFLSMKDIINMIGLFDIRFMK
jgi:hypothetical protein